MSQNEQRGYQVSQHTWDLRAFQEARICQPRHTLDGVLGRDR